MGIGDNIYYVASFLTVHLVFYQVILATFFFSFLGEQSTSLRTGFNYHHQHNINLDRTGTSRSSCTSVSRPVRNMPYHCQVLV